MPTFTRKYLKDKQGNYISTATLADMQYHSDGETTETKIQTIETTLGNGVLSTVSQNVVDGINEIADEVIAARTDTTSTYNTLDERLDAMDVKIAAAGGGGGTNIDPLIKEIEDAKVDHEGDKYDTLQDRLNIEYQELDAKFGNYVEINGDTMTGDLTIDANINANDDINLKNNIAIRGYENNGTTLRDLVKVDTGNQVVLGDNAVVTNLKGSGVDIENTLYFNNQKGLNMKDTNGAGKNVMFVDSDSKLYVGATDIPTVLRGTAISSQNTINVTGGVNATRTFVFNPNYENRYAGFQSNRLLDNKRAKAIFGVTSETLTSAGGGSIGCGIEISDEQGSNDPLFTRYLLTQHGFVMQGARSGQLVLGDVGRLWKAVYSQNGTIQTSDMRQKTDIRDIDDNIFFNLVKNSGVHSYVLNYNDMPDDITQETAPIEQVHVGIIAQEVAQNEGWQYILVTRENEDGDIEYSVNNYNLTSAIMAALKIEITKREELQTELDLVKEENEQLKERLDAIEQALGL